MRHKDGSLWAKGSKIGDTMTGYWEWFRKDGTRLRSGYFEDGEQTGKWTTYDQKGAVYKITEMKRQASKSGSSLPSTKSKRPKQGAGASDHGSPTPFRSPK